MSESSDEDDESKSKSVLRLELIYIVHTPCVSTNKYQPTRLILEEINGESMGKYLGSQQGEAAVLWMGGGVNLYGRAARNTIGGWICSLGGKNTDLGRNPRRRVAASGGGTDQEEGKWGRCGLKLPSRQCLPRDEGHARFGG
jgi:hypothetical protein